MLNVMYYDCVQLGVFCVTVPQVSDKVAVLGGRTVETCVSVPSMLSGDPGFGGA